MPAVLTEFRYALRSLKLSPGFALVAIALLALGTGANTAIFQLFEAIRLRMLPVQAPDQLVELRINDMTHARGSWLRDNAVTNPLWEEIRKHGQLFSGMFAWASEELEASPQGQSHEIRGLWVSGDFFRVLGVTPIVGHVFTAQDDRHGCGVASGAVISYKFWQQEFGGDPSVIGRAVQIGMHRIQVIGVTPPGFYGLEVGRTFDVALPVCSEPALFSGQDKLGRLDSGTLWWLTVMARRKPGIGLNQVAAKFQAESPRIFRTTLPPGYPADSVQPYLNMKLLTIPAGHGISQMRDEYERPLSLLLIITALVLLIASINLANLMLARASARSHEIAIRLAIGGSQARIAGQIFADGLLLAVIGAAAGLLIARALTRILISLFDTSTNSVFLDVHLDARVFAFTAGVAILTCILFSSGPILRASRTDAGDALKSGSRTLTSGRRRVAVRKLLVASQIAFSLVLLVGTLMFVQTLRNLQTVDPGFDPHGVLIADTNFSNLRLSAAQNVSFRRQLLDSIRSIPGVASAAEMTIIPLSGADWDDRVWPDGSDLEHARDSMRSMVGPEYFRTLRTSLLRGRDFDDHDLATYANVAIVNEAFAHEVLGSVNVIGKHFWMEATPYQPQTAYEVIGVVKNVKYHDLREQARPVLFSPLFKPALERPGARFLIRSSVRTQALISALRSAFTQTSPGMHYSVQIFAALIQDGLLSERLTATLSLLFGVLAIVLTAVGLYGVISYTVGLRLTEIGIRMALGADRRAVMALILRDMAAILLAGLALGTFLAVLAARAASGLLFGLKPSDALTFAMAGGSLAVVSLIASYVPAVRGASLNPMQALRSE